MDFRFQWFSANVRCGDGTEFVEIPSGNLIPAGWKYLPRTNERVTVAILGTHYRMTVERVEYDLYGVPTLHLNPHTIVEVR